MRRRVVFHVLHTWVRLAQEVKGDAVISGNRVLRDDPNSSVSSVHPVIDCCLTNYQPTPTSDFNYIIFIIVRLCSIVVIMPDYNPRAPGSIPGYTIEIFLEVWILERGSPSLVRTIGQLLDISSEIRLRKLKLRLRDKRLANHKALCTAI